MHGSQLSDDHDKREAIHLQRQIDEATLLMEDDLSDRALQLRAIGRQKEQMEAIESEEQEKFAAISQKKERIASSLLHAADVDAANDLARKVEHLNRARRLCARAKKAKELAGVYPTVLAVM